MKNATKRVALLTTAMMLAAGALTACAGSGAAGSDDANASNGSSAVKIGLLLPESKTTRYEAFDRPLFTKDLKALGNYDIVYANADQQAAKQQQQAESALAQGVKVLVLDPVDSAAAASIVKSANAQNVPVVAYDRLVDGGKLAYYVSFDNEKVGQLQATALMEKLDQTDKTGGILMINGAPVDSNGAAFKRGAHSVIDKSQHKILAEYDTPDWSPDKAQQWASGQIAQFGDKITGVYAANDGTAGGAIAAFKAAGVKTLPPITGQDAELTGIQNILAGNQYMTVYKAISLQAQKAAEVTDQLAQGKKLAGDTTVDGTPATLLTPVSVTADNIEDTVVKDGFYTAAQICTGDYATACTKAGIK